jgi:hypothetical protein
MIGYFFETKTAIGSNRPPYWFKVPFGLFNINRHPFGMKEFTPQLM